ncbi:MAG: hypothetical protein ACK55I_16000, partial [bacterium]
LGYPMGTASLLCFLAPKGYFFIPHKSAAVPVVSASRYTCIKTILFAGERAPYSALKHGSP